MLDIWQLLLLPGSWASLTTLPVTPYLSVPPKLQKVEGAGQEQPYCPRLWKVVEPSPGPLLPPCGQNDGAGFGCRGAGLALS